MGYTALLIIHVTAATIALFSGFSALYLRKGSPRHRATGNVFFGSMLVMAASAVCLALKKSEMIDVVVGGFTFYLVATGWLTVKREAGYVGPAQTILLFVGAAIALLAFQLGWSATHGAAGKGDETVAIAYFVTCSLVSFSIALDVSVLVRGGLYGSHRIARHIWRLCSALLFTTTAFFTPTRFSLPSIMTNTHLNYIPIIYVVSVSMFWLFRSLFGGAYKAKALHGAAATTSGAV
jgi:hypothetical protein